MKKHIYIILFIVAYVSVIADSGLVDEVTGKKFTYTNNVLKANNNRLNPFDEFDVIVPIINNEPKINEQLKKYLFDLVKDEEFYEKLNRAFKQSIEIFIRKIGSENSRHGDYYFSQVKSQLLTVEEIGAWPIFYHNDVIGFKLECELENNKDFQNNYDRILYQETILYDTKTSKISSLMDYCPKKLSTAFTNYLSGIYNESVPLVNLMNKQEDTDSDNKDDEEEDDNSEKQPKDKEKGKSVSLNINQLLFDLNNLCFSISDLSPNTMPTNGEGFSFRYNVDSLAKYLPFTFNRNTKEVSSFLNYQITNAHFLPSNLYNFFRDEFSVKYFPDKLTRQNFKLFYRQNLIRDTAWKLISHYKYKNNLLTEIIYGDQSNSGKIVSSKKFKYKNDLLVEIETIEKEKIKSIETYTYRNNFIVGYYRKGKSDDFEFPETITYLYDGNLIHRCFWSEDRNDCDTYRFDSLCNLISTGNKGAVPGYERIFYKDKVMGVKTVVGDEFYTYSQAGKIESILKDRDRYFTKYYYNKNNDVIEIVKYDSNKISGKEQYFYDEQNRLLRIISQNYSYGQLQTELEYRLEYE